MRISRSTVAGLEVVAADGLSRLIPSRDYSGLNQADSQLRVWLPEPAKLALEEICTIHETSMTAYLTEYFASYLYGYHELLRMRATRTGLYEPQPERRACAMSVVGETTVATKAAEPNLGKNIFALKIWVPVKIKAVLQQRAALANATLGEFLRALICGHLFGCDYLLGEVMTMVGSSREINQANRWESLLTESESSHYA